MSRLLRSRILLSCLAVLAVAAAATGTGVALTRSGAGTAKSAVAKFNVAWSMPVASATDVAPDQILTLSFDEPLAKNSPLPTLEPPVAGTWSQLGRTLEFVPSVGMAPGSSVTLSIPGGPHGMLDNEGKRLASPVTESFTVAPMSILRVQELLAQLGYLPLSFTPSGPAPAPTDVALDQPGSFSWKWSMPASLTALWTQGSSTVMTSGAVMSFESQHSMATDGIAGPKVWNALLADAAAGHLDPYGHYDWVSVSTAVPESTTVWRDGVVAYSTPANTGIEGASTAVGTWPVYVRYTSTTMSGTNPDGSHYNDPGVPWVSYFHGGDALHGFLRASYGSPQSLGCVEMPPANAAVVYPFTPIGTLVTIEPSSAGPAPTTTTTIPPTTTTT